jgi:hypothetical protein
MRKGGTIERRHMSGQAIALIVAERAGQARLAPISPKTYGATRSARVPSARRRLGSSPLRRGWLPCARGPARFVG